jgi:hypothetical protein
MPKPKVTEQQEQLAKEAFAQGLGNAGAAAAANVSVHTISNLKAKWRAAGWVEPPKARIVTPQEQMAPAREQRRLKWHEQRMLTGELAGAMAGRALRRANELIPIASAPRTVIEQALDDQGRPMGVPRHRVLVEVPAIELLRLVEAAKGLFQMADRSVGISDESLSVQVSSAVGTSDEERRAKVLDLMERLEQKAAAAGSNGSNGR